MLARAEWEKQVRMAAEEEEDDLAVFQETEESADADADVEMADGKAPARQPGMSSSQHYTSVRFRFPTRS